MEIWSQVDLSQWDGKAGEEPKAVKKDFTYADLATGDDEMRTKAIDWLKASALAFLCAPQLRGRVFAIASRSRDKIFAIPES